MSDRARPDTLVGRLIDAVLDVAVISFAAWTLLYCLGLPTQWSLWPSGWIWLAATWSSWSLAGAAARSLRTRRLRRTGWTEPRRRCRGAQPDGAARRRPGPVAVAAVGGLIWTTGTFRFTWAALVLGIVLARLELAGRDGRPTTPPTAEPEATSGGPAARRSSACSP